MPAHMAVGPNAGVVFVGTRKNNIYAVTDRDKDREADEVKLFAPSDQIEASERSMLLTRSAALCGRAEPRAAIPSGRILLRRPGRCGVQVVPQGELVPPAEESYNHTARVCRIGPDNKLYIALGQPHQRAAQGQDGPLREAGHRRHNPHGPRRQGTRSLCDRDAQSGRHRLQPEGQEMWFTDNQIDGMGDDTPPGEFNRVTKVGAHFGYPVLQRRAR